MGHIEISQIRIHFIENVEKYIGTCITKFLSLILRKPNPSPTQEEQDIQLNKPIFTFKGPYMRIALVMSYRSSPWGNLFLPRQETSCHHLHSNS